MAMDTASACDFDLPPPPSPAERAHRALVAQLYADLAAGHLGAVTAVLDEHVLWVEGAGSLAAGRAFGPATVTARVLPALAAERFTLGTVTADGADRVVAVGTVQRDGRVVPFRTVWRLLDGRVVGVDRTLAALTGAATASRRGGR